MSEISIKVNIAGRMYPLTVKSVEEEGIRLAEKAIEESIEVFQKSYAVKDKQDLLAMAALQMSSKLQLLQEVKPEPIIERIIERIEIPIDQTQELLVLEEYLDQYLS